MTAKKQKEKRDQRAIDEKKRLTAKMQKEARDQRAIDEKKRLTAKMQKEARDKRAGDRRKPSKDKEVSKEKEVSEDTPQTRLIKRMVQLNQMWDKQNKDFVKRYGHPDPLVSDRSFVEKAFGSTNVVCDDSLAFKIVSLVLFDEDKKMLFACSGIAIQPMETTTGKLSRFVTSKRLVTEFNNNRNSADKLRIRVRLPGSLFTMEGFLGLYDKDIAIVTYFHFLNVRPVDLDSQVQQLSDHDSVVAVGCAFNLDTMMAVEGHRIDGLTTDGPEHALIYTCAITEAGLGGPVIDKDGHFLGLIIDCDTNTKRARILPRQLLCERLQYFEKFTPNSTNFREYTLPENLFSIVPSGFWNTVKYLESMGYPKPPPLVLEINGKLLNKFQEDFGELYGYKGLDYNIWCRGTGEEVWSKLRTKVVTNICRRVVSLTSYNGDERTFACTGYLIKWHKEGTPVILTSASLIRSPVNEDKIDEKLKINVFLPPNQYAPGTLELYHLGYNIAVISVQKRLYGIRPENIFRTVKRPRGKVVAIGCEVVDGVLMGTIGVVTMGKPSNLDGEKLKLSTCKIQKAGIGGPLVNFINGCYAGMNFYDETDKTPYLPRRIIKRVLSGTDLPSQRGMNHPMDIMGESTVTINRWPVPKPYWYHPMFDDNRPLPRTRFVGRQPQ